MGTLAGQCCTGHDLVNGEDSEQSQDNQSSSDLLPENTSDSEKDDPVQKHLLTRKETINAYLNGELLHEIQERGAKQLFQKKNENREDFMRTIDRLRREELYEHQSCSTSCKRKGCETLRVIDSCWKVCMPHCMFAVEMEIAQMPLLHFPNVCTNEPKAKSVFCQKHHKFLEEHNIPTKKDGFLEHIGCQRNPSSASDIKKVDENILHLSRQLKKLNLSKYNDDSSAVKYQGTSEMVAKVQPEKWHSIEPTCTKNTGEKSHLRQRSRGHFISVTGGGHIQYFEPIFKSESPSQIFMIILRVMMFQFNQVPEEKLESAMENYVLAYDNMCHLDNLQADRDPLPFPAPFDLMWTKITKIVDRLHFKNHTDEQCKVKYDPSRIPPEHNTMIAEQTFA